MLKSCNDAGKKQQFKSLEMLQAVVLTADEWTPENGLVTAAQKVQRKKVAESFDKEIKVRLAFFIMTCFARIDGCNSFRRHTRVVNAPGAGNLDSLSSHCLLLLFELYVHNLGLHTSITSSPSGHIPSSFPCIYVFPSHVSVQRSNLFDRTRMCYVFTENNTMQTFRLRSVRKVGFRLL